MRWFNNILLLGLACLAANTILMVTGFCLDVKGQEGFQFPKFAVDWNLGYISKQMAGEFINWNIKYGPFNAETKSGQLEINNTEVISGQKGRRLHFDSTITYDETAAIISVTIPNEKAAKFNGDYEVISTDYECYAVLVGCPPALNYSLYIIQFRDKIPSKDCVETAKTAYSNAGLDFNLVQADPDIIKV